MVYNFLCKDEKTRRNIYLLLLKTSVWKEVCHFFRTVYPNRNHVTTHPEHGTCNSYTMGCPPVLGDNPRALESGLSYVQVDKHGITI